MFKEVLNPTWVRAAKTQGGPCSPGGKNQRVLPHGWGCVSEAGTPQAVGRGANPQQSSLCSGNCQSPASAPGKHWLRIWS